MRQFLKLSMLAAGLALGVLSIATVSGAVAAPCASSSGVPCSPTTKDDSAEALPPVSRGASVPGRILPDEAPAGAESDAAAADAEAGAAGTSQDSRAANSSFTFYGRNSSGKDIGLKFFSAARHWVWPSASTHWVFPADRKQYYVKLLCKKGETVCFGGWWKSNPRIYWGVGPNGDKGCSACCYTCRGGWAAVNFVR